MRWRFVLLSGLAFLATLWWPSGAVAHPCQDHAQQAAPAPAGPHVAVHAIAEVTRESHAGCPGCGVDCQMQCAASVAIAASFETPFHGGRHRFEPARPAAKHAWQAAADRDPPRPTA
jgi:hypothetical protein